MKTFDEGSQLELNPTPNQGFTCLQRNVHIAKHAVDAVLPEHGDDDSPRDLRRKAWYATIGAVLELI